jgi:hypothetical protein
MRVGGKEARTSSGEIMSSRGTAPLKPTPGLSGPPVRRLPISRVGTKRANWRVWFTYAVTGESVYNQPLAIGVSAAALHASVRSGGKLCNMTKCGIKV